MASRTPFSIGWINSLGIEPPITLSMNKSRCSLSKCHFPPLPATLLASSSISSVDISCMSSCPALGSGCTESTAWPYWPRPPVCPAPAGLLDVLASAFGHSQNRFAVRHLRPAYVGLHAEFAHHAIHNNFEVQFAHSGNQRLA